MPPQLREAVRFGLSSSDSDVLPDHDPHPEALRWALTLWSERLVGGPATRPDDPPVIAAPTRPDRHSRVRLIATTGLAKLAFALAGFNDETPPREPQGLRPRERERLTYFRGILSPQDAKIAQMAKLDAVAARGGGEPFLKRLGLITFSRLLAGRGAAPGAWALQQLPYPVAKVIRSKMGPPRRRYPPPCCSPGNRASSCAAARAYAAEGRLSDDWGSPREPGPA